MEENSFTIDGEIRETPVLINGNLVSNPTIAIAREVYKLEKYAFYKLTSRDGGLQTYAQITTGASIGLAINMVGKFLGSKIDSKIVFDTWEVYAFFISAVITGVLFGLYYVVPSEKRRIYKKIKNHFGDE